MQEQSGTIMDDGKQVGSWWAKRTTEKPIRREPEPVLSESARIHYETNPMGNDVHEYDWRVTYQGTTYTNLSPLEHRSADGSIALMMKVFDAAGFSFAFPKGPGL
jgi:hypothetical protein